MRTRLASVHLPRRKSVLPGRSNGRFKAHRRNRQAKAIQLIYAHFGPPVIFSVTERFGQIPKLEERHDHPGLPGPARRSAVDETSCLNHHE